MKKNILQGFNFNTFGKTKKNNSKGKLLIVCEAVGCDYSPFERNLFNQKNAKSVVRLVNNLVPKRNYLELKLHHTHYEKFNGYYYKKYFKNLNVKKVCNENYFKLVKNSRLVFLTMTQLDY